MTRQTEAATLLARHVFGVAAGVGNAGKMSRLSRGDILRVLGGVYPDSHVRNQVPHLRGEAPVELSGCYVAAVVFDLFDEDSSDEANLSRTAQALEFGAATLERVASGLRKGGQ